MPVHRASGSAVRPWVKVASGHVHHGCMPASVSGSGSAGMPVVAMLRAAAALAGLLLFADRACGSNPADHKAFGGPSPSCMLNHNPCPVPEGWSDWALINSTAMMARSSNTPDRGFIPSHRWGLVSLDNGVGIETWAANGASRSTLEATSAANCRLLKQSGKVARCSIYHNLELALEWLESERRVMDEAHKGWYLRWPNGSVYEHNTTIGGLNLSFSQRYIDWRNPETAAYFVGAIVNATHQPGVDCTFTDDREGVPDEHPELQRQLNVTEEDLATLQFATQTAGQYLATSLAARGLTCWDCIGGTQGERNQQPPGCVDSGGHGKGPCPGCTGGVLNCSGARGAACTRDMRAYCLPSMQGRGMFMSWSPSAVADHNQTLAAFLISRPPLAYLGGRLHDADWSPLFALDVGTPLGLCEEGPAGVFSRRWSKGVAMLDCNAWQADLPFTALPLPH